MKRTERTILVAVLAMMSVLSVQAEKTAKAIKTDGNATLTFLYDETNYYYESSFNGQIVTKVLSEDQLKNRQCGNENVTTVVFDKSFADYYPTTTSCWFFNCSKLTKIVGLQYLNTSKVTDMSYMFSGCSSLDTLNVSTFSTANVTNMVAMFSECSALKSLNLGKINTGNVKSMYALFHDCKSLTTLDVSNFNTENVVNMDYMFAGCSGLKTLDLTKFNTAKVSGMRYMFFDCSGLTSLKLNNLNTANVSNMGYMFTGCSSLKSLDVTHFNTANVTDMCFMFADCSALTSLDVTHFVTKNVGNMSSMFKGCSSLKSLDVTRFSTLNVLSMNSLFAGCTELKSLDVTNFVTRYVRDMSSMFYDCRNLTSLDVTGFRTDSVRDMHDMFSSCISLNTLDLSSFNTRKVVDMSRLFYYNSGLKNLSLGNNFRTNEVGSYGGAFWTVSDMTVYVAANAKDSIDIALKKIGFKKNNGQTTSVEPLTGISSNGKDYWMTYYNSIASISVPDGVEAFRGYVENDTLILKKIEDGIVPKGNAVILKSNTAEIALGVTATSRNYFTGNKLKGTDTETAMPKNCFILGIKDNKVGMWSSEEESIAAHTAYLSVSVNDSIVGFSFPDEGGETIVSNPFSGKSGGTTSISEMVNDELRMANGIYDLQGRRISDMNRKKGLYIMGGRKVIF
ncbi:MAG: BspA family leucine-rich repeat surface protein [Prevotella sp.]|nr:BspA family leucine-rich repeat surface protein [Prevotella sp.]